LTSVVERKTIFVAKDLLQKNFAVAYSQPGAGFFGKQNPLSREPTPNVTE
jgi:hypothetical protein